MKPNLPNNEYEPTAKRDEMKDYLKRLEEVEPDERGLVKSDTSSVNDLRSKPRNGVIIAF